MSTTAMQRGGGGGGYAQRSGSSGLYDVLDLLLDKGLVIDVFLRVSLIGVEILTVDARVVIASVDTYLRFAEAVNRLDLGNSEGAGLPGMLEEATSGGAQSKTKGILEGAKESLFGSSEEEGQEKEEQAQRSPSRSSGQKSRSGQRSGSGQRSSSSSRGRQS